MSRLPFTFQQHYLKAFVQPNELLSRIDQVSAVRLSGSLDTMVLRRCFDELARRHESLRGRVDLAGEIQYIDAEPPWSLETVQVSGDPVSDPDEGRTLVERFARRTCDLQGGPLFLAQLLRYSSTENVLVWGIHHAISDGLSINRIFRELWQLYGAFIRGSDSPLAPLSGDFSHYHAWQVKAYRLWREKHEAYWTKRLEGASPIHWPADSCAMGRARRSAALFAFDVPIGTSTALRNLATSRRALISNVALAAYVATVAQWCDQRDFVVTTLVNGRDRTEHQHVVGFLAHAVYLRMQLTRNESFLELIDFIGKEYFSSLFRKDFGGVVTQRIDLASGSLFQWLPWRGEQLAGAPLPEESAPAGLRAQVFPFDLSIEVSERFGLSVQMWQDSELIRGFVCYRERAFSAAGIQRFVGTLQGVFERMGRDAESKALFQPLGS